MYEGPIKAAVYPAGGETPVLRRLRWTDLVARLEATRAVREDFEQPCVASFAGFESLRASQANESKRHVNHDVLSHGKPDGLSVDEAASVAARGDRE
ncbi:MAG: hypothetical protein ACR2FJ_01660 [Qipengyuania sp.]